MGELDLRYTGAGGYRNKAVATVQHSLSSWNVYSEVLFNLETSSSVRTL